MKVLRLILISLVACIAAATAQTHPRLFFDAAELTQIRTKLDREPFKTMLTTLEATKDVGNFYLPTSQTDANSLFMRASASAMLYSLTGIEQRAVDCKADIVAALALIDAGNNWANTALKGLTSYSYATKTAICYDLCYNSPSWDAAFKTDISARLLSIATMIINNGGTEQNSQFSSNWQANRAASGGIALLATDETYSVALMDSAMQRLNNFFNANQGSSTRGWNPEGTGYTAYLYGSFVGPFAIALDRLQPARSVSNQPGMKWMPWTAFSGAVPATANNPYNVYGLGGVKADWSDDNAHIGGEGLYGLAFRFSPPSLLPGLRHSYDRLQGSLAPDGGLWDASRHGIFWSILYYPENTPSQNPLEIWDWQDANGAPVGLGLVTFRDGFRGENDILVHFKARTKGLDSNSHDGPDGLCFRILGPNVPFVVGGGRDNPGLDRNQATVYPATPNNSPTANKNAGTYHGTPLIKPDGGGHAIASMTSNNVGTTTHKRWIVTDFDRATTGADATVIVADTTGNGRFWQLPTYLGNTVTVTGSVFTITGQNGATLQGTIIHPGGTPLVSVGTKPRGDSYTLQNGGTLATESVSNPKILNNRYLFIENTTDNNFLVVMTIQKNGGRHPVVARNSGTIADAVIQVGGRSYGLQTNDVLYDGVPYVYPNSTITFTAGPNGSVSGNTVQSIARGAAATTPTATPDAGFQFAGWNKAFNKVATPMTVTALFTPAGDPAPTLALAASSWRVDEAAGTVSIGVTRSGSLAGAVGVNYATADGTATAGSDYTATSGPLFWADGDGTTKTITIPILNDAILENDENFTVALSSPTGGAVLTAPASAVVTISDNESLPVQSTLAFTSQNVPVIENAGSVTISIARLLSTAGTVTVSYATSSGTATSGADFTPVSGTLSWADGEAGTKSFIIPIIDDLLVEPNETFTVTLSSPTGGAVLGSPATVTVTIIDNEVNQQPAITINRPTGGIAAISSISQSVQLAATTSDDGEPGPLTFLWEKISGPGTVTFGNAAAESTTASFGAPGVYQLRLTASDGLLSDSKIVRVNAAAVGSSGLVTLVNYPFTHLLNELPAGWNEPSVTAANISASAVEIVGASFVGGAANEVRFTDTATTSFSSSDNFLNFQLTAAPGYYFDLSNPLSAVSFKHTLNSGGAQAARMQIFAGTNASGPLLFTSAETDSTIQNPTTIQNVGAIAAINGTNRYTQLHVQVQWKNIGTAVSSVYRFDDFKIDGAVVSAVDNMGPVANAGADTTAQVNTAFPLSGSATDDGLPANPGAISYLWQKVSGPGNVIFADASNPASTATFSSTGIHVLSLSADDGAITTSDTVTISVTSDVPLPPAPASGLAANAIAFNRIDLSWTDNATDETGFKILRSPTSGGVFAEIATAAANATSYSDTSCAAETTYFYQVVATNVTGDSAPSNEASATTPAAPPPAPGTIRLSAATYQVAENAGTVTLAAERIGGVDGEVSVSYATANGSATAGEDYTAAFGTLTWLHGDGADKTVVIALLDDSTFEGNETFTLNLTSATGGATLGTPVAATVTILDNETAPPPVATSIVVTPANAVISTNVSQQFSAVLRDQFGQPMASQPAFSWNVTGGGTINSAGLFTAGIAEGAFPVSAAAGSLTGNASFTVEAPVPVVPSTWSVNAIAPADSSYTVADDWLLTPLWTAGVPNAEGAIATLTHDAAPGVAANSRTATYSLGGTTSVTVGSLSLNSTRQTSGNTFGIRVGTANTQNIIFNGAGSANATLNTVGSPSGTQNGITATVTLGSNLDITGASSIFFSQAIVGNGFTITKSNTGVANFTGFTGNVTLKAGTASGNTALGGMGTGLVLELTGNTLVNMTGGSMAGINSASGVGTFGGNSANRSLTLVGTGTYSTGATINTNTSTITKSGSGTQALTGPVNNTSTISITNGKLVIDGSLTNAAAATTVTSSASNTAILAGHGTVQAVTLSGGASFGGALDVSNSTDASLGDLHATSFLWNGTAVTPFSQMLFNLSTNSASSDQLILSGAMAKGTGSLFQFDFGGSGDTVTARAYTLVTATGGFGTFVPDDFSYTGLPVGVTGGFSIVGNHLIFTTVVSGGGNTAPTISAIANQIIDANTSTGALAVTIGDAETSATSLTLIGSSSNTTLVPDANIVFGGSDTSRTLIVTPAANQIGTATITVFVSDGDLTAQASFLLTVAPNFSSWISAFPGVGGATTPAADADGDGLSNLLEYGLGSNPAAASTAPAAQVVEISGQRYLQIQWTRPDDRTDVTTLGEISSGLAPLSWTNDPAEVLTTITPAGEGLETVIIRDVNPLGANTKRFLRARIQLNAP